MIIKKVLKKAILLINYFFALLLLFVYISVYIKPSVFWQAAFLGLAYPYILLANIVFVVYWIIRKKKFFLISLAIVLLGWKHIGSIVRFSFHTDTSSSTENVKILSYNIKLRRLYNYNNEKDKAIINLIQEEKPDVICFQECFVQYGRPFHIPFSLQNLYETGNSIIQRSSKASNYGMCILSRLHLVNKGEIHFENTSNFCLYGDYLFKKDTVRIYNVHLQSIKLENNDFKMIDSIARFENHNRYQHIKEISKKLVIAFKKRSIQVEKVKDHIQNSPYKTIICGDLNDTPVSYVYHHISKSLTDSYREKGNGVGNTYISKKLAYRIDYIFHDKEFTTLWYKKPKITSSDHYPVMARIRFK